MCCSLLTPLSRSLYEGLGYAYEFSLQLPEQTVELLQQDEEKLAVLVWALRFCETSGVFSSLTVDYIPKHVRRTLSLSDERIAEVSQRIPEVVLPTVEERPVKSEL